MKNKMTILLVVVLLIGLLHFLRQGEAYQSKISPLLEKEMLKNPNESIEVIIKLNSFYYKKLSILGFKNVSAYKEATCSIRSLGGKVKYKYHLLPTISATLPASKIYEISKYPWVKKIYLDRKVHTFLQQSVPLIKANQSWDIQIKDINITGKGASVCILDTGVDYNHPALGGGWGKKVIAGYDFVNRDNDPMDDEGHGTHCAGIVAANGLIKGVAPDATLIAMKVLDSNGNGYISDINKGLEWCIDNATKYNISVISMSLGTSDIWDHYCDNNFDPTTLFLINLARERGIAVVVATGNNDTGPGSSVGIAAPACIKNATAVTASDKDDTIAYYAHRNNMTDLDAPGTYINSTYLGNGYAIMSGTSMATPHVAGAFALFVQAYKLSYHTTPQVSLVEDRFKQTGKMIYDPNSGLSFPRINTYEAVKSLLPPQINVESPLNKTYKTKRIHFNITVDNALYSAKFSVDDGENISMGNDSLYHYYNITYPDVPEGKHKVTFFVKSIWNVINSTTLWFRVKYTPIIWVVSPQNKTYTSPHIDFNITVDENLTSAWFTIDGKEEGVMINNTNYDHYNITFSPLKDGRHNITFYVNSSLGKINSTTVWFTVDSKPPSLTIILPQNNSVINHTRKPYFTFRVWDSYILEHIRCQLWVNNSNLIKMAENDSISNNTEVLFIPDSSLADGNYTWWINCSDGLLSNVSESRTLVINSSNMMCNSCDMCNSKIKEAHEGDTIFINSTIYSNNGCLRIGNKKNITIDCLNNKVIGNSTGDGIYINSSQNIRIMNCAIYNFSHALIISNTTRSVFKGLDLQNNSRGMWLRVERYEQCNNSFENITIQNRQVIYKNNTKNISISNKELGSVIFCGVNDSLIQNLTIEEGDGIFLFLSQNNTVRDCEVYDSTYGIYILGSGNIIYNNLFSSQLNVYVNGTNFWNTTLNCSRKSIIGGKCQGGNYWSDYEGVDKDGDDIGNTPYVINTQNIDYLPLKDMPPYIQILSPENKTYNTTNLTLEYKVKDSDNVSWIWYEYNQTNHTLWNGSNQSVSGTITFKALDNQLSTITLWANDTLGWINNSKVTFVVDIIKPSLYNIKASTTYTTATITWETNEVSDSRIDYGLSSNLGYTIEDKSNILKHSLTITGLSGNHIYYYKATSCDIAGNCNTSPLLTLKTLYYSSGGGSGGSFVLYEAEENEVANNSSNITTNTANDNSTSYTYNLQDISPDKKAVVNITAEDINIMYIEIKVMERERNATITIKKIKKPPVKPSLLSSKVYQYIYIHTIRLQSIEEVTLRFRVKKEWMRDNNLSKESIRLLRLIDKKDRWEELNTSYEREDSYYIYYKAKSPGFSYFAIIGIKKIGVSEKYKKSPASKIDEMREEENKENLHEQDESNGVSKQNIFEGNSKPYKYPNLWVPLIVGIISILLLFYLSF